MAHITLAWKAGFAYFFLWGKGPCGLADEKLISSRDRGRGLGNEPRSGNCHLMLLLDVTEARVRAYLVYTWAWGMSTVALLA